MLNQFVVPRWRRLVAGLVGALLLTPVVAAQAQTAVLTGSVKNEFGDPIENANVFVVELAISVGTNALGRYNIVIPTDRVRGQVVQLRARALGYRSVAKPKFGVKLCANTIACPWYCWT